MMYLEIHSLKVGSTCCCGIPLNAGCRRCVTPMSAPQWHPHLHSSSYDSASKGLPAGRRLSSRVLTPSGAPSAASSQLLCRGGRPSPGQAWHIYSHLLAFFQNISRINLQSAFEVPSLLPLSSFSSALDNTGRIKNTGSCRKLSVKWASSRTYPHAGGIPKWTFKPPSLVRYPWIFQCWTSLWSSGCTPLSDFTCLDFLQVFYETALVSLWKVSLAS